MRFMESDAGPAGSSRYRLAPAAVDWAAAVTAMGRSIVETSVGVVTVGALKRSFDI
jgi:hypothetical protein